MSLAAAFLTLLVTVVLPASTSVPAQHAAPGPVLNEFMAGPARDWNGDGSYSSRDDEWIEVFNPGAAALDLTPYLITDGDRLLRYALTGTLGAGGRVVVTGRESYDWEKATGFPAYGLSLGNSGDTVMLWIVTGGDTTLVDSYVYKSHEAAADRAVGRVPDGGAWVLLDSLDPYTGTLLPQGTGCAPTPGSANVCDDTPTRPETWGRLKTLYR
jgi:hypothetical protein